MPHSNSIIAKNLRMVRERIEAAARRARRSPSDVRLVAVTKSADLAEIQALSAQDVADFGESRPQQLVARSRILSASAGWHLIGHLQSNKVRMVLPWAACIHSVDTIPLLKRLDAIAGELQLRPRILLEVNVSGEASKTGFPPDELVSRWQAVLDTVHLDVAGLMTMAPWHEDPEATRPVFAKLRSLREGLAARSGSLFPLSELSMGMSNDFEVAIEEGATMVRIGTALFEGLESTDLSS